MGLRTQIVDLIGLNLVDQTIEVSGVCQVAVMQAQGSPFLVRIRIDVIKAIGIKGRGPADDAMNLVPFGKQELGKVGTILPGNAGDERLWRLFV